MDSIIFDLDGTLWDSTAIVARAWTEYLTRTEHMDILITEERLKSLVRPSYAPDCGNGLSGSKSCGTAQTA